MLGESFSHYRVLEKLGEGGMGSVYLAEDTLLHRQVAVKFPIVTEDRTPGYETRLLREARSASRVTHPNVAVIHDCGTHKGQPYIVMELVRGTGLDELLERGPLPLRRSLEIAAQAADALSEAHRNNVIHRDIKPANIRIDERGTAKVLDFGLARQTKAALAAGAPQATESLDLMVSGTPAYMAPEQARGCECDERTDVFALGAVLYECLTGARAFRGANPMDILVQVLQADPVPPSQLEPRIPAEVDRIVMKALAKDPALRFQSAEEMRSDINAALQLTQPDSPPALTLAWTATSRTPGRRDGLQPARRRLGAMAALLAAALLGGAAWVWWHARPYEPPAEAMRWYKEGMERLRDGTYYTAGKAFERTVQLAGSYAAGHARLAEVWEYLDYGDRAREELLRAEAAASGSRLTRSDTLYLEAVRDTLTFNQQAAVGRFKQIVELAPEQEKADAVLDLGRAYERAELLDDAVRSYQEAARRQPEHAAAFLRLGILHVRQLKQKEAAAAFDRAAAIYQTLGNLEGLTEVAYRRALLANRMGRFAEAGALLQQGLKLADTTGNPHHKIVILLQSSSVLHTQGDADGARRAAAEALGMARDNGLENLTTRGLLELGNSYWAQGNADEALKHYGQALEYSRRFRSPWNQARALFSLASVRIDTGEVEQGLRELNQSLDFYRQGGYRRETNLGLTLMTRAQRRKGDLDGALKTAEEQLALAQRAGDDSQAAFARSEIGAVHMERGRLPEALALFEKAGALNAARGNKVAAAHSLANSASALWRLGRYHEARENLDKALAVASGGAANRALLDAIQLENAGMALSQGRVNEAKLMLRRLADAGPRTDKDTAIESTRLMGLADAFSGAHAQGTQLTARALDMAGGNGSPLLVASALLAHAEALLASGRADAAMAAARDSAGQCSGQGRFEQAWRAWSVAAAVARKGGRKAEAEEFSERAQDALAQAVQGWSAGDRESYSKRPDIRRYQAFTSGIAGGSHR